MDAAAKVTSKGQITVPKVVRMRLVSTWVTRWCSALRVTGR